MRILSWKWKMTQSLAKSCEQKSSRILILFLDHVQMYVEDSLEISKDFLHQGKVIKQRTTSQVYVLENTLYNTLYVRK